MLSSLWLQRLLTLLSIRLLTSTLLLVLSLTLSPVPRVRASILGAIGTSVWGPFGSIFRDATLSATALCCSVVCCTAFVAATAPRTASHIDVTKGSEVAAFGREFLFFQACQGIGESQVFGAREDLLSDVKGGLWAVHQHHTNDPYD